MRQTDRKYDGPPAAEKRRYPVVKLPQDFHINLPAPRKKVHPTQIFSHYRSHKWDSKSFSPWVHKEMRLWHREFACEHVIKRMKGILLWDEDTKLLWVMDQATKCQLSPEFSSHWCLLNWLEYEGLVRGFLSISTSIHTRYGGEQYRLVRYKEL